MLNIVEVKTKKQMKEFAKYPVKLYKNCPYYVPSLYSDELSTFNPKKNFSLKDNKCKAFLCYKDGVLVGRIAGLINYTENKIWGQDYIRFSRFECIDDIEVFRALFKAVATFGKENGVKVDKSDRNVRKLANLIKSFFFFFFDILSFYCK